MADRIDHVGKYPFDSIHAESLKPIPSVRHNIRPWRFRAGWIGLMAVKLSGFYNFSHIDPVAFRKKPRARFSPFGRRLQSRLFSLFVPISTTHDRDVMSIRLAKIFLTEEMNGFSVRRSIFLHK